MPGPYAHITLLHELMRPDRLESIFASASDIPAILVNHFPYAVLGAVSPDYPNLARYDDHAYGWADAMHCTRTCEVVSSGIRHVRSAEGTTRDKQLSWLLGYCSHVAADMTIHPVVEAKVGPYAGNQRQHRICEMNQDSYIYRRMALGEIGEAADFAMAVARCGNDGDRTQLDRAIASLWSNMLEDVHQELFAAHPPDIASWHREFIAAVDSHDGKDLQLFPLAGVIATGMELAYPSYAAVDLQFVEKQLVPSAKPFQLHYDAIFDLAVCNVTTVWGLLEQAICANGPLHLPDSGKWNLDTGRNELGRLVFW